jgi:hypothetical protein
MFKIIFWLILIIALVILYNKIYLNKNITENFSRVNRSLNRVKNDNNPAVQIVNNRVIEPRKPIDYTNNVVTEQPININLPQPSPNLEVNFNPMHTVDDNPNTPMNDILKKKVLFYDKSYNDMISKQNKDLTYYQNDTINQDKINETAFNVVYQIDKIDYANVKTGLDKCNANCDGVCFEGGYTGVATCYPKETKTFDWGTLYKNPTFTYGYQAYGPKYQNK